MMFGGDTSRCTTPSSCPSGPRASCAACSPSHAWMMMPATTRKSSIFPAFDSRVIMRDSGTPWRYSIAMNHVPANSPNASTWHTFLWIELAREVRLVAEHRHEVLVLGEVRQDPLEHEDVLRSTATVAGARERSRPYRRSRASRSADSCRNPWRREGPDVPAGMVTWSIMPEEFPGFKPELPRNAGLASRRPSCKPRPGAAPGPSLVRCDHRPGRYLPTRRGRNAAGFQLVTSARVG